MNSNTAHVLILVLVAISLLILLVGASGWRR